MFTLCAVKDRELGHMEQQKSLEAHYQDNSRGNSSPWWRHKECDEALYWLCGHDSMSKAAESDFLTDNISAAFDTVDHHILLQRQEHLSGM